MRESREAGIKESRQGGLAAFRGLSSLLLTAHRCRGKIVWRGLKFKLVFRFTPAASHFM